MNDLAKLQERNLTKIFDNWSLFKHPQGYELINIDFKNMNITKVELNFKIWNKFFKIIQEVQTLNSRDCNVLTMKKEIENKDETESKEKTIFQPFLKLSIFLGIL